jgi:CRP-like cAMP-binding protein
MHASGISIDERRLRQMQLFEDLAAETVTQIAEGGWVIEHGRGARVLSRGDHLDGLFTVFDGQLKLYMLSCGGNERVLRILQAGDSFGEAIMFNGIPSPVFVETLSAVQLAYFPRELIADALAAHPDFTTSMLRGMSVLMRELIGDLETCCLQSARQRTVAYLLREADASRQPFPRVHLPAAKAVVASTLNISAETFSRELHYLQERGLIGIDKRRIELRDREGLIAVGEGRDSPGDTG